MDKIIIRIIITTYRLRLEHIIGGPTWRRFLRFSTRVSLQSAFHLLPCNRQYSVPSFRRVFSTVPTRLPGDPACCLHCVLVALCLCLCILVAGDRVVYSLRLVNFSVFVSFRSCVLLLVAYIVCLWLFVCAVYSLRLVIFSVFVSFRSCVRLSVT